MSRLYRPKLSFCDYSLSLKQLERTELFSRDVHILGIPERSLLGRILIGLRLNPELMSIWDMTWCWVFAKESLHTEFRHHGFKARISMMIGTYPGSRKSHVAEDIYDIPEEMYSPEVLLTPTFGPQRVLPRIYQARDASREQGRRPVELLEAGDIELLTTQAREATFGDVRNNDAAVASASPPSPATTWEGPPAKFMAEAGFCRGLNRTARCVYCTVTIRNWKPTDDPWKRHKCFSPCCKRLLQVWDAGIHPSPQGRRRLRHSCSSLADLTSHRAA